jgi:hypothetical protein
LANPAVRNDPIELVFTGHPTNPARGATRKSARGVGGVAARKTKTHTDRR